MASWSTRITDNLLNIALVIGGLVAVVLLYALATRVLSSAPSPDRPQGTSDELVGGVIQVEVRNGAGVDGLAARTTEYLRERGFDVVNVGNYSSFDKERSVVIDRVGNRPAARKVAQALGLSADRVRQEVRPQYFLDASVIIGRDYEQLRPFRR